jgi:hypothetical protein
MLAAGQYGAMSFAAHPRRMDHSMGSFPIACPCKDADIPPIRLSSSTGLRAGLFLWGVTEELEFRQVNPHFRHSGLEPESSQLKSLS